MFFFFYFICYLFTNLVLIIAARKECAKEKQLKEEEKILESVAEGRGKRKPNDLPIYWLEVLIIIKRHLLISLSALMSVKEMAKGITYEDPIKQGELPLTFHSFVR